MTTRRIHQQALDCLTERAPEAFARLTIYPNKGDMNKLDVPLSEVRPHITPSGNFDTRQATVTATDGTTHDLADVKRVDTEYHVGQYETSSLAIALSLADPRATVYVIVRLKSGKTLRYRTRITEFLNVSPNFDWFKPHHHPVRVKTVDGTVTHPNGGRIRRVEVGGVYPSKSS